MGFNELREYLATTSGKHNSPTVVIEKVDEKNLGLLRDVIYRLLSSSGATQMMEQWHQQKVLLKPNFCRVGQHGETTSLQVMDAIIGILRDYSCNIKFGDGMTQSFLSSEGFRRVYSQLSEIVRRHGVEFIHFDELREERCLVQSDGHMFYLPRWLESVVGMVNLAVLKTHPQMVGSFAVKNHMGLLSGSDRLALHTSGIAEGIWHLQSCLGKKVPQQIHIVDGLVSFQGYHASPAYVKPGVLIGGMNPCAVDFVCAEVMGIDHRTQFPQYKVALQNDFAYGLDKPVNILGANIDDVRFQCHIPDQILEPPPSFPSVRIHWGRFDYPMNQAIRDLFRAMDYDLPVDIYVGGAIPQSIVANRLCVCLGNESINSDVRNDENIFKIAGDPPAGTIFRSVVSQIKSHYESMLGGGPRTSQDEISPK